MQRNPSFGDLGPVATQGTMVRSGSFGELTDAILDGYFHTSPYDDDQETMFDVMDDGQAHNSMRGLPCPSDLVCSSRTHNSLSLQWAAPVAASRCVAEIRVQCDGKVDSLQPTATAFCAVGLEPGREYTYCVTAVYGPLSPGTDAVMASAPAITVATKRRATAEAIDMAALAAQFRDAIDVRDRRVRLTKYQQCFVGSEAVAWLREWLRTRDFADSEQDSSTLGNQLMDLGLFEHVTRDHILKNRELLYHFVGEDARARELSAPVSPADEIAQADIKAEPTDFTGESKGMSESSVSYYDADESLFAIDGTMEDEAGMFDARTMESAFYSDMNDMNDDIDDIDEPSMETPGAKHDAAALDGSNSIQSEGESLLSTDVAVEFDMRSKRWNHINSFKIPWIEQPRTLTMDMMQNVPIKGRHSKEEKDAERRAEEILRTPGWKVTRTTPLEDLEHLIAVLSKCLERCTQMDAYTMAWCVGGSLQATLDARGPDGTTSTICFLLCNKADWTGDKRSKIGSTCKFHCGGLRACNVMVGGQLRSDVFLKKCTWLKCCYGKKHYGDPPMIPWCHTCEYQKKLLKRSGVASDGSTMPGSPHTMLARGMSSMSMHVKTRPCRDCLGQLAQMQSTGKSVKAFQVCDSCSKLMTKIEHLAEELEVSNYAMADAMPGDAPQSMGGEEQAEMGNKKRQRKEVPEAFRSKLKDVMLVVFAELGLKTHAKQLDPIILDALQSKYGADTVEDLWDLYEEARSTMMRLVLRNIALGYHLYQAVQRGGSKMPPNYSALLQTVNMPDFISSWNAVLVRDGCVMVTYLCNKGYADDAAQIIGMSPARFSGLAVSAVGSVVKGNLSRIVCINGEAAEEPIRCTFGPDAVSLEGSTTLFVELIQKGYEEDAIRWLQSDSSLIEFQTVDGKTALHIACLERAQRLTAHLLGYEAFRNFPRLLEYVYCKDVFCKTALDYCVGDFSKLVDGWISDAAATVVQKFVRRHLVLRSSRVLANLLAQSMANAELNTDRLQYMAALASACSDADNTAAQMWCGRLKDFAPEALDLDDLRMVTLPPAICSDSMASLEILSLINNSLSSLPSEIKCLPFLRNLFLDDNDFTVIPAVVSEMDSLELLSVRSNKLASIPTSLLDLAQLKHLFAAGNPLPSALVPISNSWTSIRKHLRSEHETMLRDDDHTVIVIGEEGVGKSVLRRVLQPPPATGLRSLWASSSNSEFANLRLSVFEFSCGGVRVDNAGLTPFLSQRIASYVLVFDSTNPSWETELCAMLASVSAHTVPNTCQLTIVGSHEDKNAEVTLDSVQIQERLTSQFPMLDITQVFIMDCRASKDAKEFRTHICTVATQVLQAQPPIPAVFPKIFDLAKALGDSDGPILSVAEVCQATEKELGVSATVTLQALRHHAAGGRLVHLHGGDNDALDVVVTDVLWLDKVFQTVGAVSNERTNSRAGVIDMLAFHSALTNCSAQDPAILLRLLLKLEICFPTTVGVGSVRASKAVVVPSLTNAGARIPWSPVSADLPCVGYSFTTYKVIPPSFFHRLQTQVHLRIDRRCTVYRDSVELSGDLRLRYGAAQRAWIRLDPSLKRLDVVVVGQHPGPAVALLVGMVEKMKGDVAYSGLRGTLKRKILWPDSIRGGDVPELLDEAGIRDAVENPALLLAKQRLAIGRSPLSVASKQRVAESLPSAENIARLILRSDSPGCVIDPAMLVLHENGSLDVAATGMVNFVRQPQAVTVLRGGAAKLSVLAVGAEPISYQWYRGARLLTGETNQEVSIASVGCDEEGSYSCVASNEVGRARSSSAALSSYISYPEPVSAPALVAVWSQKLQLSWREPWASGESVIEYRVRVTSEAPNDGSLPTEHTISGFASPMATITGLELATRYFCSIAARNHAGWGEYGPQSEGFCTLAVPPPEITDFRFASAVKGFDPLDVAETNGDDQGSQEEDQIVPAPAPCVPCASDEEASSTKEQLKECHQQVSKPVILVNPKRSVLAIAGQYATFSVTVCGPMPYTIQWFKDSQCLAEETTETLQFSPLDAADQAVYFCRVSNQYGDVKTREIHLQVFTHEAVALGDCISCHEEQTWLWTLDCRCRCRRGFFGVCAQCTQEFVFGDSRCPMCGDGVNGVKREVVPYLPEETVAAVLES